jgi:tetratricopeptide (TPR) repeat protein
MAMLILALLVGASEVAAAEGDAAEALSAEGVAHFRRGEYTQAIEAFEASYALRPLPELLYDLAQAYRRLGNCEQALGYYRRYFEHAPPGSLRDKAAARIAELSPCPATPPSTAVAAQPPSEPHATSEPHAPSEPHATSEPHAISPAPPTATPTLSPSLVPPAKLQLDRSPARRRYTIAGLATVGAALAFGAVALYYSIDTVKRSTEATGLITSVGVWTEQAQAVERTGRRDQLVSGLLWGAAGASALTGATLLILGRYARRARVSAHVGPTSGILVYQGRF